MFGKSKGRKPDPRAVLPGAADSYSDEAVRLALTGEWLTLALSRFVTTHASHPSPYTERPTAYGVVHFPHREEKMLRATLTLIDDPSEAKRGQVGSANFNRALKIGDEAAYLWMEVRVSDPRGKIAAALQAAFDSAALSQDRFVHVSFRREKLDVDAVIPALEERRYAADHPLTEMEFRRRSLLTAAPTWSWAWSVNPYEEW